MSFYLIVYDRPTGFSADKLKSFIDGVTEITDWWHGLQSAYIIKTDMTLAQVQAKFVPHFNTISFIAVPLNSKVQAGMLPQFAWDWINSRMT